MELEFPGETFEPLGRGGRRNRLESYLDERPELSARYSETRMAFSRRADQRAARWDRDQGWALRDEHEAQPVT